jgi:hypothetical protein
MCIQNVTYIALRYLHNLAHYGWKVCKRKPILLMLRIIVIGIHFFNVHNARTRYTCKVIQNTVWLPIFVVVDLCGELLIYQSERYTYYQQTNKNSLPLTIRYSRVVTYTFRSICLLGVMPHTVFVSGTDVCNSIVHTFIVFVWGAYMSDYTCLGKVYCQHVPFTA